MIGVHLTEKDFKTILHWHDLVSRKKELTQEDNETRIKLLAFLITTQEETSVSSECNLEAIR